MAIIFARDSDFHWKVRCDEIAKAQLFTFLINPLDLIVLCWGEAKFRESVESGIPRRNMRTQGHSNSGPHPDPGKGQTTSNCSSCRPKQHRQHSQVGKEGNKSQDVINRFDLRLGI
jgi:hypothetical protein